jgi:hypothetical protein
MKLNFGGAQLKRSQIREVEEMRLKAYHNDSIYKERITKLNISEMAPRHLLINANNCWKYAHVAQLAIPIYANHRPRG